MIGKCGSLRSRAAQDILRKSQLTILISLPAYNQPLEYSWLTKGDNNLLDDTSIYPPGIPYLKRENIVGVVKWYVPFIGWIVIFVSENIWMKWILWTGLSTLVIMRT